jgi:hypothetical protein
LSLRQGAQQSRVPRRLAVSWPPDRKHKLSGADLTCCLSCGGRSHRGIAREETRTFAQPSRRGPGAPAPRNAGARPRPRQPDQARPDDNAARGASIAARPFYLTPSAVRATDGADERESALAG